jgi:hypothetical protein
MVYTNPQTGLTYTVARVRQSKDLRIVDNGDGRLTLTDLNTGSLWAYGSDRELLGRQKGADPGDLPGLLAHVGPHVAARQPTLQPARRPPKTMVRPTWCALPRRPHRERPDLPIRTISATASHRSMCRHEGRVRRSPLNWVDESSGRLTEPLGDAHGKVHVR